METRSLDAAPFFGAANALDGAPRLAESAEHGAGDGAAPDGNVPPKLLGPILRYRGMVGDGSAGSPSAACLALTIAAPHDAGPPLEGAVPLGTLAGARFWSVEGRFDLASGTMDDRERPPTGQAHSVRVPDEWRASSPMIPESLCLPGPDEALRLAFASCNGAEDEAHAERMEGGRNAMWRHLAERHEADPIHLLVMGGDQIYADALWELPSIAAWRALPRRERYRAPFTQAMRGELEAHYLATYARAFGAPEVARILASVPSVMMWDDHDIVDGWGSREAAWQASPVAQGLFETARRAFALVQLGRDPGEPLGVAGHGWSADIGPARMVVPDLRSARTRQRVMSPAMHGWMAGECSNHSAAHLLVVSSVPLVNSDLSLLERLVAPLQPLADLYQDDLRDQWMSYRHRSEWAAVMARLLEVAGRARVSVVSGEVHLGAHAIARRGTARIEQFIASGIAHPPPPKLLARAFERFAQLTRRRSGVDIEMRALAPDGRRFVAERNWFELTARPDGSREAVLHAERSGPLTLDAP